jgi:sulfopropanediol 3-dehydrogenase
MPWISPGADIILEMGGVRRLRPWLTASSRKAGEHPRRPWQRFVAEAKAILAAEACAASTCSPPPEIAVIADKNADPMTVAIDLLSQGEHGTNSPVWLFSDSRELCEKVLEIMPKLIADMPDPATPAKSWEEYGEVILCENREEVVAVSDQYAPEHLEVLVDDPQWWLDNLSSYGSLFMSELSTVTHGDKCSGPNHILPTKKAAHFSGGSTCTSISKS